MSTKHGESLLTTSYIWGMSTAAAWITRHGLDSGVGHVYYAGLRLHHITHVYQVAWLKPGTVFLLTAM